MTIKLYLLLIITVISLMAVDRKLYKTNLTPFIFFAVPYIVLIIFQFIVTNIYDWQRPSTSYIFYLLLYLITFHLVGTCLVLFMNSKSKKYAKELVSHTNISRIKIIEFTSVISSIYLIIYFILHARGIPLGSIVQDNFQAGYSSGINFYFRLFCMIGNIYFWGLLNKKRKKFFLLGTLCFIPNFITFVKGIAFLLILGSLIANMLINNRKLKAKTALGSFIIGIVIFYSSYMIEVAVWTPDRLQDKQTYEYISGKLIAYTISGVQSFNLNVNDVQDRFKDLPNPVYAPIGNILAKFGLTNRIVTINNVWTPLGYIPNYGIVSVNTNTHIGTLVLYCGPIIGLLINSLIALLIYYYFYRALQSNTIINIVRYSLLVTGLALSWFDYYYMQTFWLYLIIIFFFLKLFSKVRLK